MAIDTMTAKEKNLGKGYKLWPGFKKKAWPEIQPGNVSIPTASLKLKNICLLIADQYSISATGGQHLLENLNDVHPKDT